MGLYRDFVSYAALLQVPAVSLFHRSPASKMLSLSDVSRALSAQAPACRHLDGDEQAAGRDLLAQFESLERVYEQSKDMAIPEVERLVYHNHRSIESQFSVQSALITTPNSQKPLILMAPVISRLKGSHWCLAFITLGREML